MLSLVPLPVADSRGLSGLQPSAAPVPAPGRRQRRRFLPLVLAAAAQKQQQQRGKGFGKKTASPLDISSSPVLEQQPLNPTAADAAPASAQPPAQSGEQGLPAITRGRVFAACSQVALLCTALAFGLRELAPRLAPAVGDGQGDRVASLLHWATLPSTPQLALAVAVAAGVTAARAALLAAWPDFRAASDRSNSQVLAPLQAPADLLWVGALPGVSEELLFRGALIPAIYPDWRGAAIAGLAFGALHVGGGRNPAFAAWASLVGCAYGGLFLATGCVACPALAHALANIAAAALFVGGQGAEAATAPPGAGGSEP